MEAGRRKLKDYLKRFWGTFAALLIFAVLLASVLLYNSDKKSDADKALEKVFPAVKPEGILSIKLSYPGSEIALENEGGVWFVADKGKKHKADPEVVKNLIDDITGMESEKTVHQDGAELEDFGFVQSGTEFSFRTAEAEYPIVVGDKSPVGSGTYLYDLGEGRIVLVEDHYLWGIVDKKPDDFRERRLTYVDKQSIDRVVIRTGGFSVDLMKEKGVWTETGSEEPRKINQKKVGDILGSITGLKASGFVDDLSGDLDSYGLNEPAGEIALFGNGISETVFFGKRKDEENFYVKLGSGEQVYSASKEYFRILPKSIDDIAEGRKNAPPGPPSD